MLKYNAKLKKQEFQINILELKEFYWNIYIAIFVLLTSKNYILSILSLIPGPLFISITQCHTARLPATILGGGQAAPSAHRARAIPGWTNNPPLPAPPNIPCRNSTTPQTTRITQRTEDSTTTRTVSSQSLIAKHLGPNFFMELLELFFQLPKVHKIFLNNLHYSSLQKKYCT